ncbi:MAG: alpha/beta fold hydrolase, partial [Alphaproteobacteria bacterium]|nr:alpha/beta fold hydrolase [Alphaproteobacteria bacterium]
MLRQTFAASDGLMLSYRIDDFTDPWRPAKPLILLHAAMGRGGRFYGWVPHLARQYRVIRLDLRGHGASQIPPPDRALTMDRLVGDVCDLMDHLGLARSHVVGNSAGGYVAQNLAMGFPERAESIMLFGSTPGLRNSQAASWLPRVAKGGIRGFLTATITDRFIPGVTDPGLVNWFIDECARNDAAYVSRFIGLMSGLDWSDRVHLIRCPTLV